MTEGSGDHLNREDYVLLFVAIPSGPFETDQIRVMKGMFLLTQEGPPALRSLYAFQAYDWGPFDTGVYRDLASLEAKGLITSESSIGSNRRVYRPTLAGRFRAAELARRIDRGALRALFQAKEFTTTRAFLDLLKAIYAKYPQFAANSRLRA